MKRRRAGRKRSARRLIVRLMLWALGAGLLLLAIVAGLLAVLGMPTYDVPTVELEVEVTPSRVARGKQLVSLLCNRCHYDHTRERLSGRELSEMASRLGTLRAPNITRDEEHGVGGWSTGELALLLRTGLHPRRSTAVPPGAMPRWPRMDEDDLQAILAFLRSDDPWVEPLAEGPEPTEYSLLAKGRALVSWSPLPYPRKPVEGPSPDELEAYGEYLVDDLLQCAACHSGDGREYDRTTLRESEEYLAGGAPSPDINGVVVRAANITPHATGIRGFTSEQLRRALVDGFGPDDLVVRWPMPTYPALAVHEVEAIHAYLQTVTPVSNDVEPSPDYKLVGRKAAPGRHLFIKHGCHYCHGRTGKGVADLRGVAEHLPTDEELVAFLRNPRHDDPFVTMPPWDGILAEDEYADLCAFVRELARFHGGGGGGGEGE